MLNVTPSLLARNHWHGTPQSPTGSHRVNMAHRLSSNWSLLVGVVIFNMVTNE